MIYKCSVCGKESENLHTIEECEAKHKSNADLISKAEATIAENKAKINECQQNITKAANLIQSLKADINNTKTNSKGSKTTDKNHIHRIGDGVYTCELDNFDLDTIKSIWDAIEKELRNN